MAAFPETRWAVYDFLKTYTAEHGLSPSMREIGEAVGLTSLSSVAHQLEALEREGRIRRLPGIPRSIVVVRRKPSGSG